MVEQLPTTGCPSRDDLAGMALGKLPLESIESLNDHVETCAKCQAILEQFDHAEDSFLTGLKGGQVPAGEGSDSSLERLLQSAEEISRDVWKEGGAEVHPDAPLPRCLGQYELLEQVGRGGMGVVFKARHTMLNRTVAVKVLTARRLRDADSAQRFRQEMQAVAILDHPNIVRVYDAGEAMARTSWPWSTSRAPTWPAREGAWPVARRHACALSARRRRGCSTPTSRAWSTATSNRA